MLREMVLVTEQIRALQLSLSSITTPKSLVECTMQIGISSIVIEVIDEGDYWRNVFKRFVVG